MKVRIKTKEEFLKEFGPDWRDCPSLIYTFEKDMDYLFGKEIILNDEQIIQYIDKKGKYFRVQDGNILWFISERMFVEDKIKIDSSMISCQNIFCQSYGKHYNLNCSKINYLFDTCKVRSCKALKNFIKYFKTN